MGRIVPVVILFVIGVVVGAIALGFFGLATGYERHQENMRQADLNDKDD